MEKIRVGVVGCGEIAQIMHLRFVTELPAFQLTALCDLSESVLTALGARYGVRDLYTSHDELIRSAAVDAVVVATPDHGGPALAALDAGKHLLLEKPVSLSLADATEIADAASRAGSVAMMGYVRVFEPGYEFLRDRAAGMREVRLARSHDFVGDFRGHESLFDIVRPAAAEDLGDASANVITDKTRECLTPAIGSDPAVQDLYWNLLMGATHDLSMLRELLGPAREVRYCRASGLSLSAAVEFERSLCHLEWDMAGAYEWWDQEVTVYGGDVACSVAFPDPYIPYVAPQVTVKRTTDGFPAAFSVQVSSEPAFRREWSSFAECISFGQPVRTTIQGGVEDIQLIRELARS